MRTRQHSLVTICVPTIGRTEYLAAALRSLGEQTYRNYEVLILDNASGPAGQEVIANFASENPNARVLRVDERLPMFANFNRGIRAAQGDYVAFFHDDDLYQPTFLEQHVALLDANEHVGFAAGNFDVIDAEGRITAQHRGITRTGTWQGRAFIERLYRRGRTDLPTPGIVYRRAALATTGFDDRLPMNWGDFTVLMRIAEAWEVGVLRDRLYAWRSHGQNSSNIPLSRTLQIRTEVLSNYCVEYAARHPGEAAFVARLGRHMRRDLVRSLVWGWLVADDDAEAHACCSLLRSSRPGVASALRLLESAGVSLERRRAAIPAVRYIARAMKA
jgi:glycosyltransferase involved in cell wall biosynthesis